MSATPQFIPYFGRSWQLTVNTQNGNTFTISNATAESLRITFSVDTYALMIYWTAQIVIFNLSKEDGSQIQGIQNLNDFWKFNQPLKAGDTITLCAGYGNNGLGQFTPDANVIFQGRVLQPFWSRGNVVDLTLTLRCVVGLLENTVNFASFPAASGTTDFQAIGQICKEGNIPLNCDEGSQKILSQNNSIYGDAYHGRPLDLIGDIAQQYQGKVFPWLGPNGLNIRSFDRSQPLKKPDYSYAPVNLTTVTPQDTNQGIVKYTLIDTPQQTQDGVTFRVLLDSSVKIGDIVQIAPGVLVNLFPFQPGKDLPPIPARNGLYVVKGVRHVGDTRGHGDDWYTEITGVNQNFFANFLVASDPNAQNNLITGK